MSAYITSTGSFLPGPPIGNDEIEEVLGLVEGKPSRLKARILKANGIKTRHYAIDKSHRTLFSNAQMAVEAARTCLAGSPVPLRSVGLLSCATTQGDLVIPGFGSMVQAGLGIPEVELHTTHGICSSSAMAIRSAVNTLRLAEQSTALVVVSELASRLFKSSRYEAAGGHEAIDFDSEFLRWMLSDGAGAMLIEDQPRSDRLSLRIDWLDVISFANELETCMYAGALKNPDGSLRTWHEAEDPAEMWAQGYFNLSQDVTVLERNLLPVAVKQSFMRVRDKRRLEPAGVDWLLPHLSSEFFRRPICELLNGLGFAVPAEKWFTNLSRKGNTGSASIFIMLEELWSSGRLKKGDRILCAVPESARFTFAYAHLTAV